MATKTLMMMSINAMDCLGDINYKNIYPEQKHEMSTTLMHEIYEESTFDIKKKKKLECL